MPPAPGRAGCADAKGFSTEPRGECTKGHGEGTGRFTRRGHGPLRPRTIARTAIIREPMRLPSGWGKGRKIRGEIPFVTSQDGLARASCPVQAMGRRCVLPPNPVEISVVRGTRRCVQNPLKWEDAVQVRDGPRDRCSNACPLRRGSEGGGVASGRRRWAVPILSVDAWISQAVRDIPGRPPPP